MQAPALAGQEGGHQKAEAGFWNQALSHVENDPSCGSRGAESRAATSPQEQRQRQSLSDHHRAAIASSFPMAMSFGFSVGDFLAVGKLIADITSSLKDVGGSKSLYHDVVLELECLQKALVHLDRLQPQSESRNVDSIKYAALSCKRPLEEFLAKLRRYEASLGPRATAGSSWKAPIDKVRFMATQSDEIRKMQSYLSVHVGTLNILLAEHGLETMNLAQEKAAADQVDIRDRIETTKGVLVQVRDSVTRQAAAVYKTAALLEKLYNMVSGEIRVSWKALEGMVAAAW